MTEFSIHISEELESKMRDYPEVDWEPIINRAIKNYLEYLDSQEEPISTKELEKLSENSLKKFLEDEPEIYTDQDLIKRYK